jgi:hypothetical protein
MDRVSRIVMLSGKSRLRGPQSRTEPHVAAVIGACHLTYTRSSMKSSVSLMIRAHTREQMVTMR